MNIILETLFFIGVLISVPMGIIFPMTIFVDGLQWWNVSGSIICLTFWCLPALREFLDEGKVDLRPRFMK